MKERNLHWRFSNVYVLLIALLTCFLPLSFLKAQTATYSSDDGYVVGTTDSRVIATIQETDVAVIIKVIGIGELRTDALNFPIYYNPDALVLTDNTFGPEIENTGTFSANPILGTAMTIPSEWATMGYERGSIINRKKGSTASSTVSGNVNMNVYIASLYSSTAKYNSNPSLSTFLTINPGEIKQLFTCYFKKKVEGTPLQLSNIGIGSKTNGFSNKYAPKFSAGGVFIAYAILANGDIKEPEIFAFRSPSSITTNAATNVAATSATLNANLQQYAIAPGTNTIIDNFDNSTGGRLIGDNITEYGFIYSTSNVTLTTTEFSDKLSINGTEYAYPTTPEITAGSFVRGGYTFYIKTTTNSSSGESVPYTTSVTDLLGTTQYYAWSFMKYKIETSNSYYTLGSQINFTTTEDCTPPLAPTGNTTQSFCTGATVADLVATGTDIKWYAAASGGTALASTDALSAGTYYASQTINCESSSRFEVTVTINSLPSVPTGNATQSFCAGATVADLVATGNNLKWYTTATGGTALASTDALSAGTYYASQTTAEGCESATRLSVTVTINPIPSVPTGNASQEFCAGAAVADLSATGNNIKWYATATGGTALASADALSAGTYYASQTTTEGCESATRLSVTVTINPIPSVPTGNATQSFCAGATVADLSATGNNIKWYATATGGTALASTDALSAGTYYASQTTTEGCESTTRLSVTVTINPIPSVPTGNAAQAFCTGATVADLVATGNNLKWYTTATGGTALASTDALSAGTYYASQTTTEGCESTTRLSVTVTINPIPSVPTGNASQEFCAGATVADLSATGNNIKWYATATGGTALASTDALSAGTYYASQTTTEGCESTTRLTVTVTINSLPSVPTGNAAQSFCAGATVADLVATGTNLKWYTTATGGTALASADALSAGTYYASQTTTEGCESTTRLTVTVTINLLPSVPTGNATQSFCAGATVADLSATGNNIKWYATATGGTALASADALSAGTYYASQTTTEGCESTTRLTVTVTINSLPLAPTGNASQEFCAGATVADLSATGNNIKWYATATGGTALASADALSAGTYYASQTTTEGCESTTRLSVTVTINPIPSVPTGNAAQAFCTGATVADLSATGNNIKWYATATGGTALASTDALSAGTYYASQTTTEGCESTTRLSVTVTINPIPSVPTGNASQEFCAGATVADLSATGNNIKWYATATGGTALATTTSLSAGTYYASQTTAEGCESATRLSVTVTINPIPSVPTGNASQEFCAGATVADLSATGNTIKWYTAASGGTALASADALSAGTYYASQTTTEGCESATRFTVTVTIATELTVPTILPQQTFCSGATLADLYVVGTGIKWYDKLSTPRTALPSSTALVDGTTYYAVQTSGTCESAESSVLVKILDVSVTPPSARTPQEFCSGGKVSDLQAIGLGIKWYTAATGGSLLTENELLEDGHVYYAAQSTSSCESIVRTSVKAIIKDNITLGAPSVENSQVLCGSSLTIADIATDANTNIVWYDAATDGNLLSSITSLVNGVTYYAAQKAGSCESSERTAVTITIENNATIDAPNIGGSTLCKGALLADIWASNNQILWYAAATGGLPIPLSTILEDGVTYYAAQKAGECESAIRSPYTVVIGTPNIVEALNEQTICGSGTLADIAIMGSGIVWYATDASTTALPLNTALVHGTTYYAAQSSENCEGDRFGITVLVMEDGLFPPTASTPQKFCDNPTVANLQAQGNNVKWYTTATGGAALSSTATLTHETVYYAAQSGSSDCESATRTAVKVIIDNNLELPTPVITNPQTLCAPATLADVATDGNTNIVWYDASTGGNLVPLTTSLTDGTTYYAAIKAGNCESDERAAVLITIDDVIPSAPVVTTPQSFCPGATIANISVPNNQIVWYTASTGGAAISSGTILVSGTYYAAQKAGLCESIVRTAVVIDISTPKVPDAEATQTICGSGTLADLELTGSGIVWYATGASTTALPLSTVLVDGTTYYAAQSSGDCEGARLGITVILLEDGLFPPTASTPQKFCDNATVANLQAQGNNVKWYTTATGGTALSSTATLTHETVYYAAQSGSSDCESATRTAVKVIIDNNLELPTPVITSPQTLCGPATLADVATDGNTNIVWYDASTGGNLVPLTTPLADGTTYYAAIKAGNCESDERAAVLITIDDVIPSAPVVTTPQSFCPGATIANISVPNNQIVWYTASTGGAAISSGTILVSGTYYAAQKAGLCESIVRTAVVIDISTPKVPDAEATQTICGSGTLADLELTGSGIVWYATSTSTTALPLSTVLVDGTTYYAAQSSGDCEGARFGITVLVMEDGLFPPTASTPQKFCDNPTVANLQAQGNNVKWYTTATGGAALSSTATLTHETVYYAAQSGSSDCESATRTAVKVIIDNNLELPTPVITNPQTLCAPATLADVATDGNTNIVWYDASTGGNLVPLTTSLADGTTYYAAIKAGNCESDERAAVLINIDNATPSAPVVTTPQSFCPGATIANISVPNNQIVWYTASTGGAAISSGTILVSGTYYAAQKAGLCESIVRTAVVIDISTPKVPDAEATQTICGSGTLADLELTGSGIVWYATGASTTALPLSTVLVDGTTYYAAQSSGDCEGARLGITVILLEDGLFPPTASTPQKFCDNATVANLQAQGNNVKWYTTATGGTALSSTATLTHETVYYAAQSGSSDCESATRTAVKVIIDNNLELPTPVIVSPQTLCAPATLADVATDGNTNIVWYDASTGGNLVPLTTSLADGTTYYAAIKAGNCESDERAAVLITIDDVIPSAPVVTTPQSFCPGATIANISVPNNQIVWYTASTGGAAISSGTILVSGTYYAAQKAGLCESIVRTAVVIDISTPKVPDAEATQTICGSGTLADLELTGSGIVWYATSTSTTALPLSTVLVDGTTYYAAQSSGDCEGARLGITVTIMDALNAPYTTTPQTFCNNATVSNLQATGLNIKWYTTATGGTALSSTATLTHETVYYAAQSSGTCESTTRTAVKVIIDNNVVLDAPKIASPQNFCGSATLANIMTNGNTNIVWYDQAIDGNILPLTTPLVDGISYYAVQTAGGICESAARTEVDITISNELPKAPKMVTPQVFCDGAIIANISVPNNQIVWYANATGGTSLAGNTVLENNVLYYAAQRTGECESETRTAVKIVIDAPLAPTAPELQTTCGGKTTLGDLTVTGSGIVWYATDASTTALPLSTVLVDGTTYYAAQSSGNCEGARLGIKVTDVCYTARGTVFPFVNEGDPAFDGKFPIIVKLYSVPPADCGDPIEYLLNSNPIYTGTAVNYDGSVYVLGTPKKPGRLGSINNPGESINWSMIGKTPGTVDNTLLTAAGQVPNVPVGIYEAKDMAPGEYILEISRKGYLVRWGKVTISSNNQPLGHREILPGDVDNTYELDVFDVSKIKSKASLFDTPKYNPQYDLNSDAIIDSYDNSLIIFIMGTSIEIYQDTYDWIMSY